MEHEQVLQVLLSPPSFLPQVVIYTKNNFIRGCWSPDWSHKRDREPLSKCFASISFPILKPMWVSHCRLLDCDHLLWLVEALLKLYHFIYKMVQYLKIQWHGTLVGHLVVHEMKCNHVLVEHTVHSMIDHYLFSLMELLLRHLQLNNFAELLDNWNSSFSFYLASRATPNPLHWISGCWLSNLLLTSSMRCYDQSKSDVEPLRPLRT